MDQRNAKHTGDGRIDCEVYHPAHGWIPYTIDPDDTDQTVDNASLLTAIGIDIAEYVPPTQEELDVVSEAKVQDSTDTLLQNDLSLRVITGLLFDILKAAESRDFTVFEGVTDKETFRDHVVLRVLEVIQS